MFVKRRLNNNAVIALESDGSEAILTGSGIGFQVKRGNPVDISKVEKIFKLDSNDKENKLVQIATNIPIEYLTFTDNVIHEIKENLSHGIDDNIYIALTDHIYYAVTRFREGNNFFNTSLLWEVQNIYAQEYEISEHIRDEINEQFNVDLPPEEARMITLHIIDSYKSDQNVIDTGIAIKLMTDILNIVKYHFNIEYDTHSMAYTRFVIHLKFLTRRILQKDKEPEEVVVFSTDYLKSKMPEAYKCTQKIVQYIQKTKHVALSKNEQFYLSVHIERIVLNSKGSSQNE